MADELCDENHVPKLEELCVKFIRKNVNCWKPEEFLGMLVKCVSSAICVLLLIASAFCF